MKRGSSICRLGCNAGISDVFSRKRIYERRRILYNVETPGVDEEYWNYFIPYQLLEVFFCLYVTLFLQLNVSKSMGEI